MVKFIKETEEPGWGGGDVVTNLLKPALERIYSKRNSKRFPALTLSSRSGLKDNYFPLLLCLCHENICDLT